MFNLPELADGWNVRHISCRCDPNPLGRNSPEPHLQLPFRSARDDAIILFEIYVLHATEMPMFSMFVHRSSMLELLLQPSTDPIPFKDWGPSIVHLLTLPRLSRWITISSGQRFAMLFPIAGGGDDNHNFVPIMLFDFNPHTIRRVSRELARDPKFNEHSTMPTMMAVISDMEIPNECPYFESGVSYSLPVAWVMSRELFEFSEGIMMDEDRILGLRVCINVFTEQPLNTFSDSSRWRWTCHIYRNTSFRLTCVVQPVILAVFMVLYVLQMLLRKYRYHAHVLMPFGINDNLNTGCRVHCSFTKTPAIPIPLPIHMLVTKILSSYCFAILYPVAT